MYTEIYTIKYQPKRLQKKTPKRRRATHKADMLYGIMIMVVLLSALMINNLMDMTTAQAIEQEPVKTMQTQYDFKATTTAAPVISTLQLRTLSVIDETPVALSAEAPIEEPVPVEVESETNYAACVAMPGTHQDYVLDNASTYNIPEELGFSIIWRESTYQADVHSSTHDAGYMQINACNYRGLKRLIGFDPSNPCDPAMNIQGGFYLLREMMNMYHPDSWHSLLMIYNMGYDKAKSLWEQGIYSSKYSRDVIAYCEENFGALDSIENYR